MQTAPIIKSINKQGKGEQDTIHVEVLHEDGSMGLAMQYLQIATSDIPFECAYSGDKVDSKHNEKQYNKCNDSRLFWTQTDKRNSSHIHKQADATARSIKIRQTLLSTTLQEEGKNEDGDNEAEASDDNPDEQDGEVHTDVEIEASSESK